MLPYWLLFLFWGAGALQYHRAPNRAGGSTAFWLAIMLTALFVGLRWRTGGDWTNYEQQFRNISLLTLPQAVVFTDPAYGLLNWLAAQLSLDLASVNFVCGTMFMIGIGVFSARQTNPWLAVSIAIPYLVIVVGMGYTRQAVAISFVLIGVSIAERRGLLAAAVCVALGALFHKSAVIALPLISASLMRRNILFLFLGAAASSVLYAWVLRSSAGDLVSNYVNSNLQSSGAPIRIAMNCIAALIFLIFRRRMQFSGVESLYWLLCSILSFFCIFGLLNVSSSVGIDRVALFLIPLQVVMYSQIPYIFPVHGHANSQLVALVISYSALVMVVFFFLGKNSFAWLPYHWAPFHAFS